MSLAVFASDGALRKAVKRTEDTTTTAEDVADPEKLARFVQELRAKSATTDKRRQVDFEDLAVSTGGAQVRLAHGLGARVRWWIVDWSSSGTAAPVLRKSSDSDEDTLILESYVAGTATVRVEEAV